MFCGAHDNPAATAPTAMQIDMRTAASHMSMSHPEWEAVLRSALYSCVCESCASRSLSSAATPGMLECMSCTTAST